jgi:phosphoglucosamine mutase
MAILATDLKSRGELKNNTVVGTVMSNLGFMKAMSGSGITVETTAVGDRYVLEKMLADGHMLGGEQSGHIIMRQHANTGDGLLTALHLMQAMKNSGKTLAVLASLMVRFPQVLINVKDVKKDGLAGSVKIADQIKAKSEDFGDKGRILVRASGTEALVRVMVEAESLKEAEEIANEIASLVRSELS